MSDIHDTARAWYAAKLDASEKPLAISGGKLDGLLYFEVEIDGRCYWLTDVGLFDPQDRSAPEKSASDTLERP